MTKRWTKGEFIKQIGQLVDEYYPGADRTRTVLDNFSTHTEYAFYGFLPPAEARRLLEKLKFYFTPPHGSWLNMAEIELRTLTTQCLNRQIPDAATSERRDAAWEQQRNNTPYAIKWQSATADARTKLRTLYPIQITLEATLDNASFRINSIKG